MLLFIPLCIPHIFLLTIVHTYTHTSPAAIICSVQILVRKFSEMCSAVEVTNCSAYLITRRPCRIFPRWRRALTWSKHQTSCLATASPVPGIRTLSKFANLVNVSWYLMLFNLHFSHFDLNLNDSLEKFQLLRLASLWFAVVAMVRFQTYLPSVGNRRCSGGRPQQW